LAPARNPYNHICKVLQGQGEVTAMLRICWLLFHQDPAVLTRSGGKCCVFVGVFITCCASSLAHMHAKCSLPAPVAHPHTSHHHSPHPSTSERASMACYCMRTCPHAIFALISCFGGKVTFFPKFAGAVAVSAGVDAARRRGSGIQVCVRQWCGP
jgi:hypothetical protein